MADEAKEVQKNAPMTIDQFENMMMGNAVKIVTTCMAEIRGLFATVENQRAQIAQLISEKNQNNEAVKK